MLDVMGEDYIRTARAKGLSERRVIYRHGLRRAHPGRDPVRHRYRYPARGRVITETVFGMPGLGSPRALDQPQDLPVVIGIMIVAAAAIVVANIFVDAVYAVLDPRVRLH